MNLISIPAFQDNYIWLLADATKNCLIVDPGDAAPVISALQQQGLTPTTILLTHHHQDHTGGVAELVQRYPDITVYGPQETANKGAGIILKHGDNITVGQLTFKILAVPGHTAGHIAYYSEPYLFCGDTLFSAGCGRIFEGTPEQMYQSIQQIAALPDDTQVCCAHEYTLSNLKFARSILPADSNIEFYEKQVIQMREKGLSTLPVTLQLERKINLFLRSHDIDLQKKLGFTTPVDETWRVFAQLRERKDNF